MSTKFFYFLILAFTVTLSNTAFGQISGQKPHHHEGKKYELGLSLSLAHMEKENENALNTHIHLMRRFDPDNNWKRIALGLGFEYFFTEHKHYGLLGTVSINPIWDLICDVSPGILFTEHNNSQETQYVFHLELTYEFDMENFGIGPVIGMGLSEDDRHFTVGIHIGKGF